jgi:hypothetical protein
VKPAARNGSSPLSLTSSATNILKFCSSISKSRIQESESRIQNDKAENRSSPAFLFF